MANSMVNLGSRLVSIGILIMVFVFRIYPYRCLGFMGNRNRIEVFKKKNNTKPQIKCSVIFLDRFQLSKKMYTLSQCCFLALQHARLLCHMHST